VKVTARGRQNIHFCEHLSVGLNVFLHVVESAAWNQIRQGIAEVIVFSVYTVPYLGVWLSVPVNAGLRDNGTEGGKSEFVFESAKLFSVSHIGKVSPPPGVTICGLFRQLRAPII
jgi:hypothetical protein